MKVAKIKTKSGKVLKIVKAPRPNPKKSKRWA